MKRSDLYCVGHRNYSHITTKNNPILFAQPINYSLSYISCQVYAFHHTYLLCGRRLDTSYYYSKDLGWWTERGYLLGKICIGAV
jgi:hypothetical protein